MKRYQFETMKGGWFVGDFQPTAFRTGAAEVSYKRHAKGEAWPKHYHAVATEINLLVEGRMRIADQTFQAGDIFVMEPGEVADPEFLDECELVVVKVPSMPNDKYIV